MKNKSARNGSEDPRASSRTMSAISLRDSIELYHVHNFVKPNNETCQRRVPSCIIIGVGKCGTREITDFLRLHPHIEIYINQIYEMPYFLGKYSLGEEWLKSKMPCSYSNQITIMKNAAYFHSRVVPGRIRKFNESIKLILLVREPVSRTISHYMFFKKNKTSFDPATFMNFLIQSDNSINSKRKCVRNSKYDSDMELWLQYFNLSQFLIIESDELKTNPVNVLQRTENFLGLGHFITPDMFVLNEQNGFYCIRSNLTDTGMSCYGSNRGRQQPVLPHDTLLKLKQYFRPSNEIFFNITGKRYDW